MLLTTLDLPALETWLWEAACVIRGPVDAPKFKDYILPLMFLKRLSDVFDDEVRHLAADFGSAAAALKLVEQDHKLVRFFIPAIARWPEIARRTTGLGEYLTDAVRAVARGNSRLSGVIDVTDFNATTSGQRNLDDDRLTALVGILGQHRLGLDDVEPDLFGQAYEYLLRKFSEGQGSSAGEFFTPPEVARLMARILDPEPGQTIYDPCCGSGGLLIKAHLRLVEKYGVQKNGSRRLPPEIAPLKLFGQDIGAEKYAMTRMNAVIHDMEAEVALRDTMNHPAFTEADGSLTRFDLVMANPMWNQEFPASTYDNDPYGRFVFGTPPSSSADWAWLQHMLKSLRPGGRVAVVLDTSAVSRGSGSQNKNKERDIRRQFVELGLIDAVVLLPENLFYNTGAPGIIVTLDTRRTPADPIRLVNASQLFAKGSPKNYLCAEHISAIAEAASSTVDIEDLCRVVTIDVLRDLDFDLSPARHVPLDPEIPTLPLSVSLRALIDARKTLIDASSSVDVLLSRFDSDRHDSPLQRDWQALPLAQVIEARISGDWGLDQPEDGLRFVRCAVIRGTDFPNVARGHLSRVPYRYIKETIYQKRRPQPGDLLVEISGGGKYQNTGRVLYLGETLLSDADPPLMFTNFTKALRIKSKYVLPKYVYYYWTLLYDLGRTARYEKQPTNIKNFKLDDFLAHELIAFPVSIKEQQLIVGILDAIHAEIEATDRLRASLLSTRHASLKELLMPTLLQSE
jgi:type I restriction enzyme M protein